MQHVTTAGTALAVTLAPLVIGVLLAKSMAADPMTPVNAMVTRCGQPVSLSPGQLRRCGGNALRRWKGPLNACRRRGALVRYVRSAGSAGTTGARPPLLRKQG